MTIWQAIVLGVVQGITEFLPISSSGHLVLVPRLLGWTIPADQAFVFDVLVQLGTLLAVIVYFGKELLPMGRDMLLSLNPARRGTVPHARLGWLLVLATLPAIAAGWLNQGRIQAAFGSLTATGLFLFGTAVLLALAELVGHRQREMVELKWPEAIWIGAFQALSLFPGVSRSGSAIAGGMTRNLKRRQAARFAFLMAVPVMIGAAALTLFNFSQLPEAGELLAPILVGMLTAALVGYWAIGWLMEFLSERNLFPFALYCVLAGFLAVFLG
jgi:undecaprenyl-diphosphatase